MSNKLKQITTKAKQLYKSGKFAKWTDAIKAASASLPGAKKRKKVGYSKERIDDLKQITKTARKYTWGTLKEKKDRAAAELYRRKADRQYIGATKKKATKKASSHKDTNSHNVKISVMSGVKNKKYNVMAIIQKTSGLHERLAYYYFDKLTDAKKCFNTLKNVLKEKKERGIYTVEIVNVQTLKQVKNLTWIKL